MQTLGPVLLQVTTNGIREGKRKERRKEGKKEGEGRKERGNEVPREEKILVIFLNLDFRHLLC